ncbi:MAG: OmpH family outer membrane protein [Sedimentisphaerales bacterium]|nr:OmpH family outer membrane protein [Sedimentisphaerales bacterium]
MKKANLIVFLLTAMLIISWGYLNSQAQTSAPNHNVKIGVVNIVEVLTKCQENLDKEKEGEEKQRQIRVELDQLASEADALKQELENVLKPGSPEFMEKHKLWFDKQVKAQSLTKYETEVLSMESLTWTEALYEKLLKQTTQVAQKNSLDLVLNKDDAPLQGRKLSELYSMILSRNILYHAQSMDITAQVLEAMDQAYVLEKQAE